jgi:hypothetical protein
MGGLWYSTTKEGWCDAPGANSSCTWRVAAAVKRVNKTCSDNNIYNKVEASDTDGCFAKCDGVGPTRNTTDPCWITCFYNTVLGVEAQKPNATIAGLPVPVLLGAWDRNFRSEDVAAGGCPSIPIPADDGPVAQYAPSWYK